jgi:hypothetical protein
LGFHALLICGMFVSCFSIVRKHLREVAGLVDMASLSTSMSDNTNWYTASHSADVTVAGEGSKAREQTTGIDD